MRLSHCVIHGSLRKVWIHALHSAIHGLCKSMLCAQHICIFMITLKVHVYYIYLNLVVINMFHLIEFEECLLHVKQDETVMCYLQIL